MAVIGLLQLNRDGGWTGSMFLMARDVRVRLVPNDNQVGPRAPAFRVFAGSAELGAVWRETIQGENTQEFLSGILDFPGLEAPVSLAVFFSADGTKARAVWKRRTAQSASGAEST